MSFIAKQCSSFADQVNSAELMEKYVQTPCRTMTAPFSEWRRHVLNFTHAATNRLPTLVCRPRSGDPVRISRWNLPWKNRGMGLLYGENCTILTSTVFDWSTRVTDRQMDTRICDSI